MKLNRNLVRSNPLMALRRNMRVIHFNVLALKQLMEF